MEDDLQLHDVNVWIGTTLGALKGASLTKKGSIIYQSPFPKDEHDSHVIKPAEIQCMCWDVGSRDMLYLGHKSGQVSTFDTAKGQYVASCDVTGGQSTLIGLTRYRGTLVTCTEEGVLSFWPKDGKKSETLAGRDVYCMCGNSQVDLQVATGGRENDLKVWDGNCVKEPIFTAKNVKPDKLQLRVPVWVRSLVFVPDSTLICVGTGHCQIRLYDIRAQRRPIYSTEYGESPITAMDIQPDGRYLFVGNGSGRMGKFEVSSGKLVNSFKDISGSVRAIKCHSSEPVVVACGLDKFFRVYQRDTRKLLKKEYMRLELNCLLLSDVEPDEFSSRKESERTEEPDSCDELWESMPTIIEPANKRIKRINKLTD